MKILVPLIGGLGGQLFMLAHGYKLARGRGEVVIDTSGWYAGQGEHPDTYKDTLYKNFKFGKGNKSIGHGYFVGLEYFEPYGEDFVSMLDVDTDKINRVAVHVRRGDTVYSRGDCNNKDYFDRAMAMFNGMDFMIFTDDPAWCRENYPGIPVHSGGVEDALRQMARHEVVISSNSTLPWWASYIGKCHTVAPKKWFNSDKNRKIYRKDMVLI